ncbi:MAG: DUF4856 domain-containing protein [Psychrobium sp.]|nr:DUF4856 domain-containing protein [Psychrobium sp.]
MLKSKLSVISAAVLLSLGLSACGGSDKKNVAPSNIALAASEITENVKGSDVGALTATDDNSGDTLTFSVNDERFEVVSNTLKLKADQFIDFEKESTVALTITVTDQDSLSFNKDFTIDVLNALDTYAFASMVKDGESSVSYGGQTARQVLLVQLIDYIGSGLQADFDAGDITTKDETVAKLMAMYEKTDASKTAWTESVADAALTMTTTPGTKQASLGEISSSFKSLQGKIAGKDATGQHKDWATEFEGWGDKGATTPDALIQTYFAMLGDNVENGNTRLDMMGNPITKIYLQSNGLDLKQLTQKFLLGAVNFSQGSDDYLDDNRNEDGTKSGGLDTKGLNGDNMGGDKDGTKAYTALEHGFDEGFGYFGAARNYNDYTDHEIAGKSGRDGWAKGYNDTDASGEIDLMSEYNFGHSKNAAKRDRGSDASAATNFTKEAFDAFLAAREIIRKAVGAEFTTEQRQELADQTAIAVLTWEKAISATIIHYIREVNEDLDKLGSDGYTAGDYANLAKHWSELKGFSLGLQFNPKSPVTDVKFTELQALIGMQPVLVKSDVEAYKAKLIKARTILADAYGFDAANVTKW